VPVILCVSKFAGLFGLYNVRHEITVPGKSTAVSPGRASEKRSHVRINQLSIS
jgi:hypothetical protein